MGSPLPSIALFVSVRVTDSLDVGHN